MIGLYLLVFIAAQRLAELWLARRNTNALMERGAQEFGAGHYPLMVALHSAWLITLAVFAWDAPIQPVFLGLFIVLQLLRVWVIATLAERWTTRIIIINEPVVLSGPYRFMRHPNYAVVLAEIAVVPLALGQPVLALVFTVLKAGVLWVRIKAEDAALQTIQAT